MRPDRHIVAELKRIDPLLSVRWVPKVQRWAVYHNLPFQDDFEKGVSNAAVEIQTDLLRMGYVATRKVCEEMAYMQAQERYLVFYVTEPDGGFRPLDMRVVHKLREMDHHRRNCSLADWKEMMTAKARIAREQRERAMDDMMHQIHRDRVYKQHAADILTRSPHLRSVDVQQEGKPSRIPTADREEPVEIVVAAS